MLTGPGTISYSVCLVHAVLLAVSDSVIGRYRQDDLVLEAAFFAVPLPLSVLTHRRVEVPGRAWGQRWVRVQQRAGRIRST
ncbi:hypothetical protein [Streptomyces rhizosphaerihabitans]|uniref:hypothetical protein n=1 Tax=Streptomyces rhizosphaerihabitans TaxID=1266770 RepID=UPI0028F70259|nr:hypothetical protein [Streptomyces rhizosphaerihabitans]